MFTQSWKQWSRHFAGDQQWCEPGSGSPEQDMEHQEERDSMCASGVGGEGDQEVVEVYVVGNNAMSHGAASKNGGTGSVIQRGTTDKSSGNVHAEGSVDPIVEKGRRLGLTGEALATYIVKMEELERQEQNRKEDLEWQERIRREEKERKGRKRSGRRGIGEKKKKEKRRKRSSRRGIEEKGRKKKGERGETGEMKTGRGSKTGETETGGCSETGEMEERGV